MPEAKALGLLKQADVSFIKFTAAQKVTGLKKWRFIQHMKTPGHVCAMNFVNTGIMEDEGAMPPVSLWRSVYEGIVNDKGAEHIGSKKHKRMQYCLAEVKRRETMVCLKVAATVAISQDKTRDAVLNEIQVLRRKTSGFHRRALRQPRSWRCP